MLDDMRLAVRSMRRAPGAAALITLTLALAIGANTAIFSFAYGIWLRPLPYADADRLVMVLGQDSAYAPFALNSTGLGELRVWQDQSRVAEEMAAFVIGTMNLTGGGDAEQLTVARVTSRFFETIGVGAALGRTFAAGAGPARQDDVVVVSAGLWKRRFGGDPDVIGRHLILDGAPFTIIGVMPDGFTFPEDVGIPGPAGARYRVPVALWTPRMPEVPGGNVMSVNLLARLAPGVTAAQAATEMTTLARGVAASSPEPGSGEVVVVPLHAYLTGDVSSLLLRLLAAVGLVLLIACTNVAGVLLARAARRHRDTAIRAALGAGRWRLVRQALTESMLLGLIGGFAGLIVAAWAVELLHALLPEGSLPRLGEVTINPPVLAFTVLVSMAAGVLIGALHALHSTRTNAAEGLKSVASTHTRRTRLLERLVVCEVALAMVLLAGAGLLLKSFVRVTGVDAGFRPENVLTMSVTLPPAYGTLDQMKAYHAEALERIAAVPGVAQAGAVNWLPFGGHALQGSFATEGVPDPDVRWAEKVAASSDYFSAMGIEIVQGRPFNRTDSPQAQGVAIVSEGLARRLWSGETPIGRRVSLFGPSQWLSVVGVTGDVKRGLKEDAAHTIYVPLSQAPHPVLLNQMTFVLHSHVDPASLVPVLRSEMRAVDPAVPLYRVSPLEDLMSASIADDRFRTVVVTVFAGLAVLLVATGLVGALGYSVGQRSRELGLRMALGARRGQIGQLVFRQALVATAAGVVIGLGAAVVLTRYLTSYLFGVHPNDALTFAGAAFVLACVAALAAAIPAHRASRVDPMIALRAD